MAKVRTRTSAEGGEGGRRAGGIGDEAVRRATGRAWDAWLRDLDAAGGRERDHKGIVALVLELAPEAGGWWSQAVAVAYEQERGLRAKHEKADGFAASKSRTFPVPVADLWAAWSDARRRRAWLGTDAEVRARQPERSLRLTWPDDTRVHAYFHDKGPAKSAVQVQHERLASAEDVARAKALWSEALDRLAERLA